MEGQIISTAGIGSAAPSPSAPIAPWEAGEEPGIWTTLSAEDTLRAINDAIPGADALDHAFKLVDIVIHEATVIDNVTNEEVTVWRTILIDDKARGFAFVSNGVIASLKQLCSLLDKRPPFDPPITVKVVQKPTSRGFRVYRLTLA